MIDSVDGMLSDAAGRFAIDVNDGYTEGYERVLAREVCDRIPKDRRPEILRWLIHGIVMGITVGEVNMLDETADDTYQVIDVITETLDAAVRRQEHADRTLLYLIGHEIMEREHMERVLKSA